MTEPVRYMFAGILCVTIPAETYDELCVRAGGMAATRIPNAEGQDSIPCPPKASEPEGFPREPYEERARKFLDVTGGQPSVANVAILIRNVTEERQRRERAPSGVVLPSTEMEREFDRTRTASYEARAAAARDGVPPASNAGRSESLVGFTIVDEDEDTMYLGPPDPEAPNASEDSYSEALLRVVVAARELRDDCSFACAICECDEGKGEPHREGCSRAALDLALAALDATQPAPRPSTAKLGQECGFCTGLATHASPMCEEHANPGSVAWPAADSSGSAAERARAWIAKEADGGPTGVGTDADYEQSLAALLTDFRRETIEACIAVLGREAKKRGEMVDLTAIDALRALAAEKK